MKSKLNVLLLFVSIMALALCLWFLLPRSLDQALGKEFRQDEIRSIQAVLINQVETRNIVLTQEDPAYADLMELLEAQRYLPVFPQEVQDLLLSHHVILAFGSNGKDFCIEMTGEPAMRFYGSHTWDRWFRSAWGPDFQKAVIDLLLASDGGPDPAHRMP